MLCDVRTKSGKQHLVYLYKYADGNFKKVEDEYSIELLLQNKKLIFLKGKEADGKCHFIRLESIESVTTFNVEKKEDKPNNPEVFDLGLLDPER